MGASGQLTSRCPTCFGELTSDQPCSPCSQHGQRRASTLALPPGTLLAGQYLIGQVLGKPGGFGITYLAWDQKLETRIAIKEFFPRDLAGRDSDRVTLQPHSASDEALFEYGLKQFLQEARTLARFDHANIVRVRNFFEANGTGYLVMDYYEGQSLAAYVAAQPGERLKEELSIKILLPVLDGLRAVHTEGILHRDIDPQNIYLTSQGKVILLDFGAARTAVGEKSHSLSVVLKPGYAPYEQYSSSGKQGPWTDVYACAATLYRMVTGKTPPDAPSRIMEDTLRPAHELNPKVSRRLSDVLQSALALRPEQRPQTTQEFQQQLIGTPPPPPPPPPAPPLPPGSTKRSVGARAVALAGGVGLLVAAVVFSEILAPAPPAVSPISAPAPVAADPVLPGPLPYPPSSQPGSPESASPRPGLADARPLSGTWHGVYVCSQGLTGMTLHLEGQSSGEVQAVLQFYPLPQNPVGSSGAFRMAGTYGSDGSLRLEPTLWLEQPPGYVAAGLDGSVDPQRRSIAGRVTSPACGEFRADRA